MAVVLSPVKKLLHLLPVFIMDSCHVFSVYQEVNGGIVKKYCPQHLVSVFFWTGSTAVVGVGMGVLTAASEGRIS